MKLQKNIFKCVFKKNILWFCLLYIIIGLCVIFYSVRPNFINESIEDYLILISYPFYGKKSSLQFLITLYYLAFNIVFFYDYLTYEIMNSCENIILRVSSKKWIISKIFFYFFSVFLFCLVNTLVLYLFFYNNFNFNIEYIFIPFLYFISSSLIVCFIYWLLKNNRVLNFIFSLFFIFLLYNLYNFYIVFVLFILFLFINILFFDINKLNFK